MFNYQIDVLSALTDSNISDFEELDIDELSELTSQIKWVQSEPSKRYKNKLDNYVLKPFSKLTLGEFIDLENYISDWQNMHKAMAVLFRPIYHEKKEFYDINEYEGSAKYSEVMLDMPVDVAIGAMVFFYRLGSKLPLLTMDYLQTTLKKEGVPQQLKPILGENGDGINRYIHLLKEMSEESMKLQKQDFINV